MAKLEPGATAPGFSLPDDRGDVVSLADQRGRRVLVYFYPADNTPGCTKEACQFNDRRADYAALGVEVFGISPDGAESHQRFRTRYGLEVRLLSDPTHEVMQAYGAWGEKTLYGKKTIGVIRSTFLIDADGIVERAWYNVRADGHADKVLDVLRAGGV